MVDSGQDSEVEYLEKIDAGEEYRTQVKGKKDMETNQHIVLIEPKLKEKDMPLYKSRSLNSASYLSSGLCFPRVKSILTLLTAISSSFRSTPPFFCELEVVNNPDH